MRPSTLQAVLCTLPRRAICNVKKILWFLLVFHVELDVENWISVLGDTMVTYNLILPLNDPRLVNTSSLMVYVNRTTGEYYFAHPAQIISLQIRRTKQKDVGQLFS